MLSSSQGTPVATPVSSPINISEPIGVILQKSCDVNEKIRLVHSAMNPGARVAMSDANVLVDNLPGLLMLVREVSLPSAWLTQDSADKIFQLFSIHSQTSITRMLPNRNTKFVFPLTSLPLSIDWSSDAEFSFLQHLSYNRDSKNLINLHAKTITLTAVEYFIFTLAVLPLVNAGAFHHQPVAPSTTYASTSVSPTVPTGLFGSTASFGGSSTGWSSGGAWYSPEKQGTIQARLLREVIEVAVADSTHASVPLGIAQKCELALSLVSDLYANISLFTFSNPQQDFSVLLHTLTSVLQQVVRSSEHVSHQAHRLGFAAASSAPSSNDRLVTRTAKLITSIFDTGNVFSQKFLHKINPAVFRALTRLWRAMCVPWDSEGASFTVGAKDAWLRRHGNVYGAMEAILKCPTVQEFVTRFTAASGNESRFTKFLQLGETKDVIDGIVDVLEVASPTTGIAEAMPGVFATDSAVTMIHALWSLCRSCTWVNHKTPKSLTDQSWRMDNLVNAAASATSTVTTDKAESLYKVFTWESGSAQAASTDGVPRKILNGWVQRTKNQLTLEDAPLRPVTSWEQPVSGLEVAVVVSVLRLVVSRISGIDLKRNPLHFAWVRQFASVSVLSVLTLICWVAATMWVCPGLSTKRAVAVVQIVFIVATVMLAAKWTSSQYVV